MSKWFGKLPETWQALQMRQIFSERSTKVSDKEYAPLTVGYMGVVPQLANVAKTDNGDNRKLIKKGDFAINSRSDRKGAGGISEYDGSCSVIITVLKPHNELNGRFYHYLLRSHYFSEEFYRNGYGIVDDLWSTKWKTMRTIYLPVPPREEQDKIVRFLDWKVFEINRLIAVKKREIELLEELKRSAVNEAVKPKEGWKTVKISRLFIQVKNKNIGMLEKNLLSLSYGNVVRRNINATGGLLPLSFEGYNIIEKDDIVLRMTDLQNDHTSLRTGIARERGIITSAYLTIRNISDNSARYMQLYLHAFDLLKGFYNVGASGVRQSLGWEEIKKLTIPLPPREEQDRIVAYLDRKTAEISDAISKINDEIQKLEELKKRLISDVVTGQIDVRNIKVPEFEYVEETADRDEIIESEVTFEENTLCP